MDVKFGHKCLLGFSGVEYIISECLFEALLEEEQKLWHSHCYEVCVTISLDEFLVAPFCVSEYAMVCSMAPKNTN